MRKKCTTIIEVNKTKIAFTNKPMTAYGGFSLLAAFFEKIGLKEMIDVVFPVRELSPNSMGLYAKTIAFLTMVFAGADRFSHLACLGNKEVIARIFGVQRLPDAATTLTRLFGKMKKLPSADALSDGLWQYLSRLIPWGTMKADWLNFDSTVLERYGEQEGSKRGYNPKKHGRPSHHPLIAFLNTGKYVVHLWNRSGNASSGNNIVPFFTSAYRRVKDSIVLHGVIADSGFYLKEFVEALEGEDLVYIIAVRLARPLQREIYTLADWKEIDHGIQGSQFTYAHAGWKKQRRYVVIRQNIRRRKNVSGKMLPLFANEIDMRDWRYSVWITNTTGSPSEVWRLARPRANDENTIKELKEDFALGGFSMKRFYPVEAAMLLRVLAYNLFVYFKYEFLSVKERSRRLHTLRYTYFILPGQMGRDGRDVILRISASKRKIINKLVYLFGRISQYVPQGNNCIAFDFL
jgi:hypothetical protein